MSGLEYDRRYRCRYCGSPCQDGGVCVAHADLVGGSAEWQGEDPYQLTLSEALASIEDEQAREGTGS